MNFYLFGLQRTGTNLVQHLMESNFAGKVANQSEDEWKHSLKVSSNLDNDVPILKVIKSPYTWVESIVFRERADFYEKHDFNSTQLGPVMVNEINLHNLIHVYKTHYQHWKAVGSLIKYEDILYPEQQRKVFADLFHEVDESKWIVPEAGSMFMCEDFKDEDLEYYNKQRPKKLSGLHVLTINKILEKTFFKETGYRMLRTART